jgi:two-component system response regulator AtoC
VTVPRRIWLIRADVDTTTAVSAALSTQDFVIERFSELPRALNPELSPAVIVLGIAGAGMPALNVLVLAQKMVPPIPVIALVPPDQARIAVEALKLGACDALVTPVEPEDLLTAIAAALGRDDQVAMSKPDPPLDAQSAAEVAVFISRSPKMLELWNVATTVARSDVPVLIVGESGVGKEVLARFLCRHSRRADKPIIKVNCAALPHDLLESELFGYERGAFTGAIGEKPGKFELADKGCILLDEIGEMPPSLQAKLLHVLEDHEFSRLGGKKTIKVDARVIAMTNRKLHEAMPKGEFREDLYFRLSVVKMSIPPLRERKDDIPLLVTHFLKRYRDPSLGNRFEELPPHLIDSFLKYDWPGNVRQLENTIRRYLILPDLDMELNPVPETAAPPPVEVKRTMTAVASVGRTSQPSSVVQFPTPNESISLKEVASMAAEQAEREVVLHVLEQTNWNRSQAARRLNICYRALLNKLKKWQMKQPRAS